MRKHLLTIEALTEETLAISGSDEEREHLSQLSDECKEKRAREERKLCGHEVDWEDLAVWSRAWRKKFEAPACDLAKAHGNLHRHAAVVHHGAR